MGEGMREQDFVRTSGFDGKQMRQNNKRASDGTNVGGSDVREKTKWRTAPHHLEHGLRPRL